MSMPLQLPADIEAFVKAEVAGGAASDEAEFVKKAVELYRDMKVRHAELWFQVQRSLEQSRAGESVPLDIDEIFDRPR